MDSLGDDPELLRALGRLLELLAAKGCTDEETFQVHLAVEDAFLAAKNRRGANN
jgi:hypothetical protein